MMLQSNNLGVVCLALCRIEQVCSLGAAALNVLADSKHCKYTSDEFLSSYGLR